MTLWELSKRFGLSHPDSASDLIRRGAKRLEQSTEMVIQLRAIDDNASLKNLDLEIGVAVVDVVDPVGIFRLKQFQACRFHGFAN